MANKKTSKSSKPMAKKDMKKTKGGTLNFAKIETVQHDISFSQGLNQKVSPGQINMGDGSV